MRRTLVTLVALGLVIAFGAPALAGGWAVTTLDELPDGVQAGATYQIGYTIRQHGATPVNVEDLGGTTEIRIAALNGGKTFSYPGLREGPKGHYVAKVTFPHEGEWTWQVTQGPFQAHPLGSIKVAPAPAAMPAQGAPQSAAAPAPQAPVSPFLVVALVLATAGAAILFGTRIAAFVSPRASA